MFEACDNAKTQVYGASLHVLILLFLNQSMHASLKCSAEDAATNHESPGELPESILSAKAVATLSSREIDDGNISSDAADDACRGT